MEKKKCTTLTLKTYILTSIFLNKLTRGKDRTNLQDKTILKHCDFIKS